MPLTLDPSWAAYKLALTRLADASQRLEQTCLGSEAELQAIEQDFQDALQAYDIVRQRMDRARSPETDPAELRAAGLQVDGRVVRLSGLASIHQHITFAREQSEDGAS